MMSDRARLSIRYTYTNHSLRASTEHLHAQIQSRHTMSVTGHKSENSFKTYSGDTDESTKKKMFNGIKEKPCAAVRLLSTSTSTVNYEVAAII